MTDRFACFSLILAIMICSVSWAQDSQPDPKAEAKPEAAEKKPEAAKEKPAAKAWATSFGQWKDLLGKLRALQEKYKTAEESELDGIRKEYNELVARGTKLQPLLYTAATKAYLESPEEDRQLTRFLISAAALEIKADRYQAAAELAKPLVDNECEEQKIYDLAGIAAFCRHDFLAAGKYLETAASATDALSESGGKYLAEVENYKKLWPQEQALRKAEAEADDLPRVLLKTNKGDILVELFENQAPQTVGNFISLVEKKFYNGLSFHRVLQGFMAQAGCPKGDGTGGPGYKIYCECYKKEHRKHFSGTLSMAKAEPRDTGGSQFFITFVPTSHLNGRHTAFGRVIEGMDVLAKIQRRNPMELSASEPDKIISAEVVRKRDHKYVPTKVK